MARLISFLASICQGFDLDIAGVVSFLDSVLWMGGGEHRPGRFDIRQVWSCVIEIFYTFLKFYKYLDFR